MFLLISNHDDENFTENQSKTKNVYPAQKYIIIFYANILRIDKISVPSRYITNVRPLTLHTSILTERDCMGFLIQYLS